MLRALIHYPMSTPAAITEIQVREQLRAVKYPGFSRDIVSFGIVKEVQIAPNGRDVTLFIGIATNQPAVAQQIHQEAGAALRALPGIGADRPALSTSRIRLTSRRDGRRPQSHRRHQARPRRGQRQGRRGQIDRRREPRRRAAAHRGHGSACAIATCTGRVSG